jgi:hypothetical protein
VNQGTQWFYTNFQEHQNGCVQAGLFAGSMRFFLKLSILNFEKTAKAKED